MMVDYHPTEYKHGDSSMMGICPACGARVKVTNADRLQLHSKMALKHGGGWGSKPCPFGRTTTWVKEDRRQHVAG